MKWKTNKLEDSRTSAAARVTASGGLEAWQPSTGAEVSPHSVLVCSFREGLLQWMSRIALRSPGYHFYVLNLLYTVPLPPTPTLTSVSYRIVIFEMAR